MSVNVSIHEVTGIAVACIGTTYSSIAVSSLDHDGDPLATETHIFMPAPACRSVADAYTAAIAGGPSYADLLAFVEEVRDHKPCVISGRDTFDRSGQSDVDDMMPVDEFYAFQSDAEKLAPKPGRATTVELTDADPVADIAGAR